jgi:thiol-disulfide isomerase/thioredoxin
MPEQSMWDGSVELPEGIVVPLRMSLDLSDGKTAGYFLVDDEKTPIPEISRNGDSLTLRFSEYGAEIRANWTGNQLSGNYVRIRSDGTKSIKFNAVPETGFSAQPAAESSRPMGNFQVLFQGEDSSTGPTLAKFWDKGSDVYGTFIAPDGDYGLLVGRPSKKSIQLSRFTGWQAIAVVLEPKDATWSGQFYSVANAKPKPFVLQPRTDLNIEASAASTRMKDPNAEFTFSGVSLQGETIRNTDERFKGKALILDIMGTWCHNCLDEAPVLQKLYKQYGKDGLEVVGLSFEISDDPALAKKNIQLFKDRFGLTYTLLFCGSTDDENVKKRLHSQIDHFFAYPTAIFLDKKHKVTSIHNGFKGPGTGDEFLGQIREFQELVARLL